MKTISRLAIAATLLAGAVGYAVAQSAEPPAAEAQEEMMMAGGGHGHGMGEGHGKGRHGDRGGRMMKMIDADGDGVIGEDEAAAMADRMFMRLDQNGDDAIDQAEFLTPRGRGGGMRAWFGWGADEAAAVQKVRADRFATLDADKDGKLTKVEFFAAAKARLAAADTDKDGKVSPWEFRAAN